MVYDAIGNELKRMDLVQLALNDPHIHGKVVEIKGGGIITGLRRGGGEVSPGLVTVVCTFTFPVDPTNPQLGNVLKLCDPNPEQTDKAREMLEQAEATTKKDDDEPLMN